MLVPKHGPGNSLIVQLVLNGTKLQPCRLSFFDTHGTIIAADQALPGGKNLCELWEGFAAHRLGVGAAVKNRTPWGGGVHIKGRALPYQCGQGGEPAPPTQPVPGDCDYNRDGS